MAGRWSSRVSVTAGRAVLWSRGDGLIINRVRTTNRAPFIGALFRDWDARLICSCGAPRQLGGNISCVFPCVSRFLAWGHAPRVSPAELLPLLDVSEAWP